MFMSDWTQIPSSHTWPRMIFYVTPGSSGWEASVSEAAIVISDEHEMTVLIAIKAYSWSIAWALTVSMSVIMEGYDTILSGFVFGYPAYKQQFGNYSGI